MNPEIQIKNLDLNFFKTEKVDISSMSFAVAGKVTLLVEKYDQLLEGMMKIYLIYQNQAEGVLNELRKGKVPVVFKSLTRVNFNYCDNVLEIRGELSVPYLYTAHVEIPIAEVEKNVEVHQYLQQLTVAI